MSEDLHHRLTVYRQRFQESVNEAQRDFYLQEILRMQDEIEAEEAVEELINECIPQLWTVVTDSLETVDELIRTAKVIDLDFTFSWRYLKFMYTVKFYQKAN